jgi:hypothetical protein
MPQQPTPVGISPEGRSQPQIDYSRGTRQHQRETGSSRTGNAAYGAQTHAVMDPEMKLVGFETGFQDSGRLVIGWIVDGTAIANAYRVQVEKGTCPVVATALSQSSAVPIGATTINSYAPGTCVVMMHHDKTRQGIILGALPDVLDTEEQARHPYVTLASRKRVDDCHKKYIKQKFGGQILDWSNWRPFDGTLGGEWGAVSTTGLAITLDDFMAQISVNEACGVFAFYHDSFLRVAGQSLQVWTAGSEREAIMDQAEYNDYQGYNAYPWEAAGLIEPGQEVIKQFEKDSYLCPEGRPYYGRWEPYNAYQQPYHRTQHFYGYLGQGGRNVLHAPPEGVPRWTYMAGEKGSEGQIYESAINTQTGSKRECNKGDDIDYTPMELKPCMGFHEDNVAMDGRRFIASAKGITFAKRMLLPMPTRIRRPEDPQGDDADKNYKAGGKSGKGPDHEITGDLATNGDHPHLQRASCLLDLHGYLFNYAGLHPFHWHTKDYKLWQQSEIKYADERVYNHKVPDYNILKGKMYLPQPEPKELYVDHRYKKQKFYESECFVSLLDDGSVVIGDGYGSEIKMSAGCLVLSAPGDVWIKSGRSSQIWSGADCIIRSVDDIDMSTTNKNIRIKSEQNIMMLAGNDEKKPGGVLIESRAPSPTYQFEECGDKVVMGGIVLRAPKAEVVGLAERVYLRTGGGGSETIKAGSITLDAGRGESEIITKSKNMYQYVGMEGKIYQFFRDGIEDEVKKANSFSKDFTLLCGPIGCNADLILGGFGLFKKSIVVGSEKEPPHHIFTTAAAKGLTQVAPCDSDCHDKIEPALDAIIKLIEETLPKTADDIEEQWLDKLFYEEGRPGNARTMDIMEFSFRTDEQYKIPDFLLFEDRWQQMARLFGKLDKTWTEKKVKNVSCPNGTWPFPGGQFLEDPNGMALTGYNILTSDGEGLYDADRGAQGSLSGPYRDPKFKELQKQKINGNYPIIGR